MSNCPDMRERMKIIDQFKNGQERYWNDPLMHAIVQQLVAGMPITIELVDELLVTISDLKKRLVEAMTYSNYGPNQVAIMIEAAKAEMAAWHPLSVPPMGVKTVIVRDETPEGYRYHLLTLRKGGSWQPTKQEWHTQPQWTDGVHVGEFYDVVMCLGTFRNPEWREVQP